MASPACSHPACEQNNRFHKTPSPAKPLNAQSGVLRFFGINAAFGGRLFFCFAFEFASAKQKKHLPKQVLLVLLEHGGNQVNNGTQNGDRCHRAAKNFQLGNDALAVIITRRLLVDLIHMDDW